MILVILVYTLLPASKLFLSVPLFSLFLTIYVTVLFAQFLYNFSYFIPLMLRLEIEYFDDRENLKPYWGADPGFAKREAA